MEIKIRRYLYVSLVITAAAILGACQENVDIDIDNKGQGQDDKIVISVSSKEQEGMTRTEYNLATRSSQFAEGDKIGIFAYNGSTPIFSNIPFTYDGTSWTGETDIPYSPAYTYLAYYPYRGSNGNPPYAVASSGTADDRLANFIADTNDEFHMADQSTPESFAASDYMHATGTDQGSGVIAFVMEHRKALAVLYPGWNKWYDTTDPITPHDTYATFTGNIPYIQDGYGYYHCKANTATVIGGVTFQADAGKSVQGDMPTLTGTPTLEYSVSIDGGQTWSNYSETAPEWLGVETRNMNGIPTEFQVNKYFGNAYNYYEYMGDESYIATATSTTTRDDITSMLRSQPPVSGRDLSLYGNNGSLRATGRTTANSYIVHAPGTYRIPLVYGNAVKDGVTNSQAYHSTESGTYVKTDLVNHAGNAITGPWINDMVSVDECALLWQDAEGVITSVGYDNTDKGYLTFSVSESSITECNALVAAKSAGTIVWSWHVWVTPQTLEELTDVDTGGYVYHVAPVNVGFVTTSRTTKTYIGNQCRVKASLDDVSIGFTVKQADVEKTEELTGYSPYYQWGRKDPFLPSNGTANTDHTAYSLSGTTTGIIKYPYRTYVQNAIKEPTKINGVSDNNSSWCYGNDKYNLWDINNNGTDNTVAKATSKTVYDPCPPGFCVPTAGLFYYMYNNYTLSEFYEEKTNFITFMTNGPELVIHKSGQRDRTTGRLLYVNKNTYHWSATPGDDNQSAYNLWNSKNNMCFSQAFGLSILPTSE